MIYVENKTKIDTCYMVDNDETREVISPQFWIISGK